VAIKKHMLFHEHKVYAQRLLRELKVGRLLNHENALYIRSAYLTETDPTQFKGLYVVTDIMDGDLKRVIDS